jgi:hypothetical protein
MMEEEEPWLLVPLVAASLAVGTLSWSWASSPCPSSQQRKHHRRVPSTSGVAAGGPWKTWWRPAVLVGWGGDQWSRAAGGAVTGVGRRPAALSQTHRGGEGRRPAAHNAGRRAPALIRVDCTGQDAKAAPHTRDEDGSRPHGSGDSGRPYRVSRLGRVVLGFGIGGTVRIIYDSNAIRAIQPTMNGPKWLGHLRRNGPIYFCTFIFFFFLFILLHNCEVTHKNNYVIVTKLFFTCKIKRICCHRGVSRIFGIYLLFYIIYMNFCVIFKSISKLTYVYLQ